MRGRAGTSSRDDVAHATAHPHTHTPQPRTVARRSSLPPSPPPHPHTHTHNPHTPHSHGRWQGCSRGGLLLLFLLLRQTEAAYGEGPDAGERRGGGVLTGRGGWMDVFIYICMRWMDVLFICICDICMYILVLGEGGGGGCTHRVNGWMDGWMDGWTNTHPPTPQSTTPHYTPTTHQSQNPPQNENKTKTKTGRAQALPAGQRRVALGRHARNMGGQERGTCSLYRA
jgi:hypothetical protein